MSEHNISLMNDAGILHLGDASIVIAHTEWNDFIVNELLNGCRALLEKYGLKKIETLQVPGAFELPFACKRYFEATRDTPLAPDALIALGCVIRGGTPHFDYVCKAVTDGITRLNLELPIPVIFGVLTVDDEKQARDRIGGEQGHKGAEAAVTALKMIAFNRQLRSLQP